MSTATQADAVLAATRPFALYALGQHVADHSLPFEQVSVVDQVNVYVLRAHAHAWRTTSVTETDHSYRPHIAIADAFVHTADLLLHGSCVQFTLRWFTYVDHHTCEGCGAGLCACLDLDALCPGRVAHACSHGRNLCPGCQHECSECVDDRRQDRAAGWSR